MDRIETDRLILLPLTHGQLKLWHRSRREMEVAMGLNPSEMLVDSNYLEEINDALENFWLPMTASDEPLFEWFTNWEIVHKDLNLSIGGIGFVGFPENGIAETGFMLDGNFSRKGFATEALNAIVEWAFRNNSIKAVKARTYNDNATAQALLKRCGFQFELDEEGLLHFIRKR